MVKYVAEIQYKICVHQTNLTIIQKVYDYSTHHTQIYLFTQIK